MAAQYELDTQLLEQLYKIRSYSRQELQMTDFIKAKLTELKISFSEHKGNIYNLSYADKPILSAHQDMVFCPPDSKLEAYYKKIDEETLAAKQARWKMPFFKPKEPTEFEIAAEKAAKEKRAKDIEEESYRINEVARFKYKKHKIKAFNADGQRVSLGADDKNGIFAILELFRLGFRFNFIFSIGEECGCIGIKELLSHEEIKDEIKKKPYAIVIDRRNATDIIGFQNSYCVGLDLKLEEFAKSKGFGFKCASGLCSDADHISSYTECVNISCGYYHAHNNDEYTDLRELRSTIAFLSHVLKFFKYESLPAERYKKTSTYSSYSSYSSFGNYGNNFDWKDEQDYIAGRIKKDDDEDKKNSDTTLITPEFKTFDDYDLDNMDKPVHCMSCKNNFVLRYVFENYGECPYCGTMLMDDDTYNLIQQREYHAGAFRTPGYS